MRMLAAQGARLALPAVMARGKSLAFRAWSPDDRLMLGPLGILEPSPAAAELQVAVMRLARRLRAESPNDSLTPSQLGALATLGRLGPQAIGDLANTERVKAPSMTKTVANLAKAGLVIRRQDPSDARLVIVELTEDGRERLQEHRSRRRAWLSNRLGALSEDDRALLADACRVLGRLVVE